MRRFHYDAMPADEFNERLERIELKRDAFARLTGANRDRIKDWSQGREDIPHYIALVLHLLELPQALGAARALAARSIREDRELPGISYPFLNTDGSRRREELL